MINDRADTNILWQYLSGVSAMRGMGKSIAPTLITIFGTCVLRMIWVDSRFFLSRKFGFSEKAVYLCTQRSNNILKYRDYGTDNVYTRLLRHYSGSSDAFSS